MELYTIVEVAEMSGQSQKTIRRHIASGKLKADKISNKYFISGDNYESWMELDMHIKDDNGIFEEIAVEGDNGDTVNWLDIKDMWSVDGWADENYRNGYNFVDLFSGAGGLSCGLTMAGFTPVATVEIMPEAVDTYRYNFIEKKRFSENVKTRDIRLRETKQEIYESVLDKHIHLIVGGFPCQGFSMAGHRVVADQRNSLYLEMLEIVKKIQPDYVIMENVEGLRSMLGGRVEAKIINDYKQIGYDFNVTVLNSADYGVPQIRKRVIFIGNRHGLPNYHPKPIYCPEQYITLGQGIERFMNMTENKQINHIFTTHSPEMTERIKKIPEGMSLYGNYSDAWKKSPWDKPSCTIKENHGGVNIHPKLPRVLTPRELAALQSFPDDFIFKGSKKWQLVQIGNAVPPLLGKAVGLAVQKGLESLRDMNEYCNKLYFVKEKVSKYLEQIFKVYGNELLLRLEEYNLLTNEDNCIETSTAIGFIMEEFITAKLELYTSGHNTKGEVKVHKSHTKSATALSYDCFIEYEDIFFMINIKVQKAGASNSAVAAINTLYNDYVVKNPGREKAYMVFKTLYDIDASKRDGERKIIIKSTESYYLEEVDFSTGHKQDHRNWSEDFKSQSGRLMVSKRFREKNKIEKEDLSYEKTAQFIEKIYNQ